MDIKYENETWVIEDEYFITREVHEYTVYNCGTETEEAKEQFSSESFEECLEWVWRKVNSKFKMKPLRLRSMHSQAIYPEEVKGEWY